MFKKKPLTRFLGFVLIGALATFSTPLLATNQAMLDLLKILHDKGSISAKEYQLLLNVAKTDDEKFKDNIIAMETKVDEITDHQPKINTNGKLEFVSANGENRLRLGGRVQYDTTLVGTDGHYEGSSEAQLRRARIYLSGTWAKYWDFKFQYDIEDTQDSNPAIEDAYIKYTGWPIHIRLGQGKNPYSMNNLTSSKYIAFIERSFVTSLFNSEQLNVGGKALGVTLSWNDMKKTGLLAEGSFSFNRQTCDRSGVCTESPLENNGFTGRLVWASYDSKARQLIHTSVAGGYRNFSSSGIKRLRVRPNVSAGDARILDTGPSLLADSYYSVSFNIAGMYDRFWGNIEYLYGDFDLNESAMIVGDTDMSGFIIQGGVFLTAGDNRRYKNGKWNSVKVKNPVGKGGYGAWEVAVRYDQAIMGAGIQTTNNATDQEAVALTAALNFYPVNNIRLQANYVKTFCDGGAEDRCAWDSPTTESNPNFFILRAQTFF